jgi:DNA-directed RNA polymerase subunit RPC12/RpoP
MPFNNKAKFAKVFNFPSQEPFQRDLVLDQMRLARLYRLDLLINERNRRDSVEVAVHECFPGLRPVEESVTALEAELARHKAEVKARNSAARRKTGTPEDRARTADIKARLAQARCERKRLRDEAFTTPEDLRTLDQEVARLSRNGRGRQDALAGFVTGRENALAAFEASNPQGFRLYLRLREIEERHHARALELRANCGVHWGSYLAVEDSLKGMRKGAPPEVKFPQDYRTADRAKVAVQVQGGLSWFDVLTGRDNRVRVQLLPPGVRALPGDHTAPTRETAGGRGHRLLPRAKLWLRVGSDGRAPRWAEVPFRLSRVPPPDAKVKWVYLQRTALGFGQPWEYDNWDVQFVLERETPWEREDAAPGGLVTFDIGWRLVPEGLRVAAWRGSDDESGWWVIPHGDIQRWRQADELRSVRDRHFDSTRDLLTALGSRDPDPPACLGEHVDYLLYEIRRFDTRHHPRSSAARAELLRRLRAELDAWCRIRDGWPTAGPLPAWWADEATNLPLWKSKARLARLAHFWRDNRYGGDDDLFEVVEAWRRRDKHLGLWEVGLRARTLRWRTDLYRNWVAELRRRYRTAAVEDTDWRDFQKLPEPEEASAPGGARHNRRIAAPGRLAEIIKGGFAAWKPVATDYSTRLCSNCGRRLLPEEFDAATQLVSRCPECGHEEDQDVRAAEHHYRRATAEG